MMSWMWYLISNLTCDLFRRSSKSALRISLYFDFLTMPSTALRPEKKNRLEQQEDIYWFALMLVTRGLFCSFFMLPLMKYLVNLPEFGMESHQLPASLTVNTPDFTSCLVLKEDPSIFTDQCMCRLQLLIIMLFLRYLWICEQKLIEHLTFAETQSWATRQHFIQKPLDCCLSVFSDLFSKNFVSVIFGKHQAERVSVEARLEHEQLSFIPQLVLQRNREKQEKLQWY